MANLNNYLSDQCISVVDSYEKEILGIFFPIQYDTDVLREIKNRNGEIIQRLDGVYYHSKHGLDSTLLNRNIEFIYSNLSTFIIFQSEYSRRQCFSMFGEVAKERHAVIYNGVNKKIFYPIQKEVAGSFKLVTTGNFRNLDMLEPVVKALDLLDENCSFTLSVVGPVTNDSLRPLLERSYIEYLGVYSNYQLAEFLRSQDIFIYSHLNPPCPNSVLEAVSTGLPVVGYDSGAMSELVHFSKELLAPVSDDIFQTYEQFNISELSQKIRLSFESFNEYKLRSMNHTRLFDFDDCGHEYVKVFVDQLKRKSNLPWYKKILAR